MIYNLVSFILKNTIHYALSHNPVKTLEQVLSKYRTVVKEKESENGKATYFAAVFLYDVFKVDPADIEWEHGVKTVYMKKRGRIDAVFGNLIFEFKKNLPAAIKVAEEELLKYFQTYHEKYAGTDFIGIANDGILFKVYKPIFSHTETGKRIGVVGVRETDSLNLDKMKDATQIYNWFDSYLFLQHHIVPTSDDIRKRFGLKSATYNTFRDKLFTLHELIGDTEYFKTKFQNWSKYLEIVYGDPIEELDLFIRHTYLSTLVKLIVHIRLTGGKVFQEKDMPIILHGHSFHGWGIHNFVEEDFFTWITYPHFDKKVNPILFKLLNEVIEIYDLENINEDVLKELYQELVDPEYRQELGEFYTPDWLAEMTIDELLKKDPKQSVLDPSCGSGTFLFSAIKYKIEKLRPNFPNDNDLLEHLLSTVRGFDIHPLAVIIAKTNYLLALGKLPNHKKHPIEIPVYLCDSVKLPSEKNTLFGGKNVYEIEATEKDFFQIPTDTIIKTGSTDDVIKKMHDHAKPYQDVKFRYDEVLKDTRDKILATNRKNLLKGFKNSLKNFSSEPIRDIWIKNYQLLIELIDKDKDSIWPYIIKNASKPMALSKNKVDVIMGNPPWITIKKMKNDTYKKFLKDGSKDYGLLDKTKKNLFTHMELASLFFCIVVDLYLKDKGRIGFVMPSSILRAAHHQNFMKFLNPKFKLEKIIDGGTAKTGVINLFKVPSCAIFGTKGGETTYPVPIKKLKGKLPTRNEKLKDVKKILTITTEEFEPFVMEVDSSHYFEYFFQGATLMPRNFVRIEIADDSEYGIDPLAPEIRSDRTNDTKKPWKDTVTGQVESDFLFASIIGNDLIPFGIRNYSIFVLPIFIENGRPRIIDSHTELQQQSFLHASSYFENLENEWNEKSSGEQAKLTVYQQLNFFQKIKKQDLNFKFKVLYVSSSTFLAACVINLQQSFSTKIGSQEIPLSGFIAEHKTYYFETNDEDEAFYICGILNSKTIDDIIKPLQTAGLWGERDIHKRPLTLPIPEFSKSNKKHIEIVKISKACSKKVPNLLQNTSIKKLGTLRSFIRNSLKQEMDQIDSLTKEVLLETDPKIEEFI